MYRARFQRFWCLALVMGAPLAGCGTPDDDEAAALNVNSRYIIESVHVSDNATTPTSNAIAANMSDPLRTELDKAVGAKFDDSLVRSLADRIKKDLRVSDVTVHVTRGTSPDHVIVNFEVHQRSFDMIVGEFAYDSREGWTGDASVNTALRGNTFSVGLVSDGNSMIERFTGVQAKFERANVISNRVRVKFEFDDYHEQWNGATLEAAAPGDIYRSRAMFTPEATVVIFSPLEDSFGVSFARLSVPEAAAYQGMIPVATAGFFAPVSGGTKTIASNAVINTLRYHKRWGSEHDAQEHEATASYSVTAASGMLGSDEVFARHEAHARYRYRHGRSTVEIGFLAGVIDGNAPLFERFVLGDSTTLRGWSRFDLDPVGGTHVVHGSIDYRWRFIQAFYDSGAIWDQPQQKEARQSAGVGFKKENFQLAVAFPLCAGRVDPIFYAGMNF